MSLLWRAYQKTLLKHPILIQAVQTGILMGTGDIISQTLIEKKYIFNVNLVRTAKFASVGFFLGGPGLRFWYGMLNKYVGSHGTRVVLKKVALDQIVFAPIFLGFLLGVLGAMQGQTFEQNVDNIKRDYVDVLVNNYKVWPLVQLTNFYLVPLNYQVLIVQIVAIFWNTYISWKTNIHSVHSTKEQV